MKKDAEYWIKKLSLEAHPEGGYYRQTYRADLVLTKDALPQEFMGARAASTAIYFCWKAKISLRFIGYARTKSGIFMWDQLWLCMRLTSTDGIRKFCWAAIQGRGSSAGGGQGGMLVCLETAGWEGVCAGGLYGGTGIRF